MHKTLLLANKDMQSQKRVFGMGRVRNFLTYGQGPEFAPRALKKSKILTNLHKRRVRYVGLG